MLQFLIKITANWQVALYLIWFMVSLNFGPWLEFKYLSFYFWTVQLYFGVMWENYVNPYQLNLIEK